MKRREFLTTASSALVLPTIAASATSAVTRRAAKESTIVVEELTLAQIAAGFGDGRFSSRQLTRAYLDRIERLDRSGPMLRAVIETNPQALAASASLDQERRAGKIRGPLHGVPVLIKDNIETADRMMTTAGSLALEGWYAPDDAPLVAALAGRQAR